jgi:signal transduction histidine kinase
MIDVLRQKRGSMLDNYCAQLGALAERRHTELALVAAKEQAEISARLANQAMLQAQETERAKTKFLANMTHELRTPLNAIIGFSEIIEAAPPGSGADHTEYAKYIHDAGLHLLSIVNFVLELARIEAGKLELDEQIAPLDEVLQAAVRAVRPMAEAKSIEINGDATIGGCVQIDPGRMKQIFVNLLSNAIKFSKGGSRVDVAARLAGDHLVVAISDTGIGIPEDHLERVLEPFGQIEDHLTRQSDGAGLGLPLARALVRAHGGELVLNSRVGVGTTAEVRLPRSRVRQQQNFSDG